MQMGMSWEQYWYGDVRMTASFIEAHRLKRREENERLWLQGMYFFDGMSRVLSNAFAKKGAKKLDYPDKPYPLFEKPKTQAEIERENEIERQRAHDYFAAVIQAFKDRKEGREIKEKF